jgi:hypothetical protein
MLLSFRWKGWQLFRAGTGVIFGQQQKSQILALHLVERASINIDLAPNLFDWCDTRIGQTFYSKISKIKVDNTRTDSDEGLEKAIRGGEWKPFKISRRNLIHISNRTIRPFFLTRPRPPNYRQTIDPRNRVRNRIGNTNLCRQDYMRDWQQKLNRKTVYILTNISLNTWWARSRNHRRRAI